MPAALVASGGNNQTVAVGSAFPSHLGASLKNSSVPPGAVDQPGVPVVFTVVPNNGAGGNFGGPTSVTVATGPTGVATAPQLTASGGGGTFTVTASTGGLTATFTETNTAAPVASHGYWLVGGDGGIFTFGSAKFWGSTGNIHLNRPVVGITPTVGDLGYWLDASDGGIFAFGNAPFEGSIPGLGILPYGYPGGGRKLAAPIVGMVPSSTGQGYFMVGADGGVFAFGDAKFNGSCPSIGGCSGSAVAVMPDGTGNGYWLVTTTGHVYGFGDAGYLGAPGPQVAGDLGRQHQRRQGLLDPHRQRHRLQLRRCRQPGWPDVECRGPQPGDRHLRHGDRRRLPGGLGQRCGLQLR